MLEDQVKRGFNGTGYDFEEDFANIYREYNGDASALVEIYIDKNTKKIIGGAIIPLWTESKLDGNYRALPINEIFTNKKNARRFLLIVDGGGKCLLYQKAA